MHRPICSFTIIPVMSNDKHWYFIFMKQLNAFFWSWLQLDSFNTFVLSRGIKWLSWTVCVFNNMLRAHHQSHTRSDSSQKRFLSVVRAVFSPFKLLWHFCPAITRDVFSITAEFTWGFLEKLHLAVLYKLETFNKPLPWKEQPQTLKKRV